MAWRDPRVVAEVFRRLGARPLGEGEAASLAACGPPSAMLLLKVVEQDLDVPCAAGHVSDALGSGANARWVRWLTDVAADPRRSARTRLRAGLAVLGATGAPVPGLGVLLEESTVADERARLVAAWEASGEAPAWAPPSAHEAVAWARWRDGDLGAWWAAADRLRLEAELGARSREGRERLLDDALAPVGLGSEWFARMLERRGRGLPIADLDRREVRVVDTRLDACVTRSAPSCLRLAADLIEGRARAEDAEDPEAPARPRLAVVWEVAYDGAAVASAERAVGRAAAYVGDAPSERRLRLLGLLAHPRHGLAEDAARALPLGDPLLALALRRGTPWATAALALAVGQRAGVAVHVASLGDGVVLDVDGRRVAIGPCGAIVPAPEAVGEAWPVDAVIAQAAIELAGTSLRAGEGPRALRLATLAESLDPVGAAGVTAVVRSRLDLDAAGALAGSLVPVPGRPEATALEARRARAATWDHARVEWNQAGRPACPSPLGP